MKNSIALTAISLLSFSCFGGGGETPEPRYFVPSATAPTGEAPTSGAVIQLATMTLSPHLEGDRLAARTSNVEIDYYRHHRWAGSLDRLLSQEARRYFRPSFAAVVDESASEAADYQLIGHIEKFEEEDEESGWFGHVGIQWTLRNNKTGKAAWSGYLSSRKSAAARNPSAVVEALNAAFSEVLAKTGADIQALLKP